MPCFNHGIFIAEAIGSVVAQTFSDWEIIVVDDGSTDRRRCRSAGIADSEDAILRTDNRGLPAARNLAARQASGALFCALDADDRLAPAWFEKGVAALDAQPELAFVSHWLQAFGDEQWTWTPMSCDLPAFWLATPSMARPFCDAKPLTQSAAMTSRCARVVRIGIYGYGSSSTAGAARSSLKSSSTTGGRRVDEPHDDGRWRIPTSAATPRREARAFLSCPSVDVIAANAAESFHLQREMSEMDSERTLSSWRPALQQGATRNCPPCNESRTRSATTGGMKTSASA